MTIPTLKVIASSLQMKKNITSLVSVNVWLWLLQRCPNHCLHKNKKKLCPFFMNNKTVWLGNLTLNYHTLKFCSLGIPLKSM